MWYSVAADLVMVVHLAFVIFVIFGAFLAWRWSWMAWLHLPALVWAVVVTIMHWTCPLTPIEKQLREAAGESVWHGSFIDHYITPLLYPEPLGEAMTWTVLAALISLNLYAYGRLYRGRRRSG